MMKFINRTISAPPSFGSKGIRSQLVNQPAIHIRYQKAATHPMQGTLTLEHIETLWADTQDLSSASMISGQWIELIFQQAPRWGHYRLTHDLKDGTEPTAVFNWLSYNELDGVTPDIEMMPLLPAELV